MKSSKMSFFKRTTLTIACSTALITTQALGISSNLNWEWVTFIDGAKPIPDVPSAHRGSYGKSITMDSDGNTYIAGASGRPVMSGPIYTSWSSCDPLIFKLDPSGSPLWVQRIDASPANAEGVFIFESIAMDPSGNLVVVGMYHTQVVLGETTLTSNGTQDTFVAKLDQDGNWIWAVSAGGLGSDYIHDLAIDTTGNIFVTGSYYQAAQFGEIAISTSSEYGNIFVAKLNTDGDWIWVRSAGGVGQDEGHALALSNDGNLYITGTFHDHGVFGSNELTSNGSQGFVWKLSLDGTHVWAQKTGSTSSENILFQSNDSILIAGNTNTSRLDSNGTLLDPARKV